MTQFIVRRAWQGILTLLILAMVVFVMSRSTGDPLNLMLPVDASIEQRELMERRLGLDRSLPEQFVSCMAGIVRGDLGTSIRHRAPVTEVFLDRFPNSLRLILPAFILAWVIAVPLAVIGANTRSRWLRQFLTVFATVGIATPLFWLAIVLILIFSVQLGWFPSSRMGGIKHYVLPVTSLALFLLAGIMRFVRSSMLDSLGSEYVKFARIKGVSERKVVWNHALRNSMTSGLSFLGVYFSVLVTGSIVIEKVFAWPGAGRLLYDGIVARDYPLVQGIILISAVLIILVNITFDILHAYLDPRVRL